MQTLDNAWLKVKDIQNSVCEIISRRKSWYITKQLLITVIFCTCVLSYLQQKWSYILFCIFRRFFFAVLLNATQGILYCILVSGFLWIGNTDFPVYRVDTGYCELREANLSWDWESSSWSDKNRCWCENGSITMVINWLGPTWSQLGAWIFYFCSSANIASAH